MARRVMHEDRELANILELDGLTSQAPWHIPAVSACGFCGGDRI